MTTILNKENLIRDDFYLCQMFSKAISSNLFNEEKSLIIDFSIPSPPVETTRKIEETTKIEEKSQWKIGDLCLCPFSEDGLLYKATILEISSSNCSIRFDDYGNEEEHLLTDLQIRTDEIEDGQIEEDQQEEEDEDQQKDENHGENDETPHPMEIPPLPQFDSIDTNENLSSTLMSWYLAGYHTGYYQAIKQKKSS